MWRSEVDSAAVTMKWCSSGSCVEEAGQQVGSKPWTSGGITLACSRSYLEEPRAISSFLWTNKRAFRTQWEFCVYLLVSLSFLFSLYFPISIVYLYPSVPLPTIVVCCFSLVWQAVLINRGIPISNFALSVKLSSIYMTRTEHSNPNSISIFTMKKNLCIPHLHFFFSLVSSTDFSVLTRYWAFFPSSATFYH